MKAASGDDRWLLETAEESRQAFLKFSKFDLADAQEALERAAQNSDVPAAAKALEVGLQESPGP